MNSDKLKSIISKKANGNSDISMQLYQMFFFEKIWYEVNIMMEEDTKAKF